MIRPSKENLIEYNVHYPKDTEFSAFARLLQSKWRVKKGYSFLKYGNFLDIEFAKESKSNFLTDNIRQLVTDQIAIAKKSGGLIGEPRIWNNLLSSQPLCFNLFGEMYYNLNLATKFFKQIFPNRIDEISAIKFEYSPGRGNAKYIGDRSAFDVFIEYTKNDKKGFIGIEVKYAESLKEETIDKANKNFKESYAALTGSCGFFKLGSIDFLRYPPLSQIWRDHLLCIATKQDYDEGFFVFLFPSKNSQCQMGVDKYKEHLAFDTDEENCFYPCHIEDFITSMTVLSDQEWTTELKTRYLGD